ncbi:hypothetical protein ACXHXM_34245
MNIRDAQRIIGDHPLYVLRYERLETAKQRRAARIVVRHTKRGLYLQ